MNKPHVSMIQERRAALTGKPVGRSVSAALSSEEPVIRMFGSEVLVHSADAIDMSRAERGLPLLVNHDRGGLPIGRIEAVRLDGDKLRGDLIFSEATEDARAAFSLVEDGTLTDVSISYKIDQWERGATKDDVRVTRWTPLEASLVSVPADGTVGIGRMLDATEKEASTMPTEDEKPEGGAASIIDTIKARSSAGFQAGAAAEGARLNEINKMTAGLSASIPELSADLEALAEHARGDVTVGPDAFRALAFDLMSGNPQPLALEAGDGGEDAAPRQPAYRATPGTPRPVEMPGMSHRALVQPGADVTNRAAEGMELTLLERAGSEVKPEKMEGNQYRGWSLLDLARESLELHGHSTRGWSSEQIARAAISMGARAISPGTAAYGTADFPSVTENVITKRINDAYAAAAVNWSTWCSTTTVPDFKQFTIPRLSQVSDLPIVLENAAYEDLTQVDAKESATLVKHGGLMSFTWEALVNDDQRMFSRTSASMGESAARTVDKKAYAVLTDNGNMGDATPLFDALHGNTGTLALTLDNIVTTRTKMARQTDDNGELLGIVLRYVIVPEELRDTADNLAGSEYLPWTEASPGAQRVNTLRTTFEVVPTVRLTDANDWYAASSNGGTIEVAFLNGNQTPMLMREDGWDTDAMHWKIRHPSVAYAVDWRGLQSNIVV